MDETASCAPAAGIRTRSGSVSPSTFTAADSGLRRLPPQAVQGRRETTPSPAMPSPSPSSSALISSATERMRPRCTRGMQEILLRRPPALPAAARAPSSTVPYPWQAGHHPFLELKENDPGSGSGSDSRQRGQARSLEKSLSGSPSGAARNAPFPNASERSTAASTAFFVRAETSMEATTASMLCSLNRSSAGGAAGSEYRPSTRTFRKPAAVRSAKTSLWNPFFAVTAGARKRTRRPAD